MSKNKFSKILKNPTTIAVIAVILAALIAIVPIMIVLFGGSSERRNENFITLELSPAITFMTDSKGKVLAVYSLNEDGDVMLRADAFYNVSGMSMLSAAKRFAETAARLGYLDVDGDVMKITCPDTNYSPSYAENLESNLQLYLRESGMLVATFTEVLSDKDYKAYNGLAASSGSASDALKSTSTFYRSRPAVGLAGAQLRAEYESSTLYTDIKALAKKQLDKLLTTATEQAAAVRELMQKNDKIIMHPDNPLNTPLNIGGKDYFALMQNGGEHSPELSALILDMTQALSSYQQKYGVNIKSNTQLIKLNSECEKLETVTISLKAEDYTPYAKDAIEFFSALGNNTDGVSSLLATPESFADYDAKSIAASQSIYLERYKEHANEFSASRMPVGMMKYEQHVNNIIEDYGSLKEYMKAKHSK